MFGRVIKFTGVAKQVFRPINSNTIIPLYVPKPTVLNYFLFSEEKKPSITPKKPVNLPPADDESFQV